ncbi:MAG: 3-dehydroquinate synthase [Desulfobacterales bacterium]|nr:3-dehydroquinate synthase [Desulfobacterales bacterium]
MKEIKIKGCSNDSSIFVGESLDNLSKYIGDRNSVIITDEKVSKLYGDRFPHSPVIQIGTGEKIKTMDTVLYILRKMVQCSCDRSTILIGIGGGIVTDIAGFAASLFMRGISFGFVSTTLLAQVDASCGGKNGVNLDGFKNMIGVFNQPEFVICDTSLLSTLPDREISCGFAEIIKHAAIFDSAMFKFLSENYKDALSLDKDIVDKLVYDSVVIKSNIVNQDETEQGVRKKLNFGHTYGHAIEKITDYNHGEAISIGMVIAAKASGISEAEDLSNLLQKYNLPVNIGKNIQITDALSKDKKRKSSTIDFVFLSKIGGCYVKNVIIDDVATYL